MTSHARRLSQGPGQSWEGLICSSCAPGTKQDTYHREGSADVDLVLRHYRDGTETMKPGGNNDLLFLMVDLDNFKPVNESCGHEAGDELLLQIRDVLLDASRSSDDVIRWGGDEFLVVARDTNRKFAATLAERIRSSLSQRLFPVGNARSLVARRRLAMRVSRFSKISLNY